jgi:hypothetical protein
LFVEHGQAARLLHARRHLRDQLVGPDANRRTEREPRIDVGLDRARNLERTIERRRATETEERLVDAERLDVGRVTRVEVEQLERERDVLVGIALDVLGVRTEPPRLLERHPCAHAERPRLVRSRSHDAAAPRIAAHDDRLAAKPGVLRLLDRREERIHVDEQHGAARSAGAHRAPVGGHRDPAVHARRKLQRGPRGS